MLKYPFTIVYRLGRLNSIADALTHCSAISATANFEAIKKLHESMVHPEAIRLYHFVKFPEVMYWR